MFWPRASDDIARVLPAYHTLTLPSAVPGCTSPGGQSQASDGGHRQRLATRMGEALGCFPARDGADRS